MKYSIITINYNHAEGLRRTIESVVNQTCKDYEYIIIDGGSTDGSVDVIKEYADKIDFWVSEPDKGIYNAMNKGIDHAHGEYLNFMNSGDCFYSLMVLEEVMSSLTADIVSGAMHIERQGFSRFSKSEITLFDLFGETLPHQASFIRYDLCAKLRYDESFKVKGDWAFWVKALVFENCSFKNINSIVCEFQPDGISSITSPMYLIDPDKEAYRHLLPERILKDYEWWKNKKSPMLELIPLFNHTYRFQKIVCFVVSMMIKIYNLKNRI